MFTVSLLKTVGSELEQLYVKQPSLEVYFEWLDSVIEKRVSQVIVSAIVTSPCLQIQGVVCCSLSASEVVKVSVYVTMQTHVT